MFKFERVEITPRELYKKIYHDLWQEMFCHLMQKRPMIPTNTCSSKSNVYAVQNTPAEYQRTVEDDFHAEEYFNSREGI